MHIDFTMFLLKQKKLNDTLLPLYIFPQINAMHLNLKAKG